MATRMNQNILWGYSNSQHSVILHKNPPRLFYSLSAAEKGTVAKNQKAPSACAVDETRRSLLTLFWTYLRWYRNAIGQLRVPTVNQLPLRHAESPPLHLADARMGTRRPDHLHRPASHCCVLSRPTVLRRLARKRNLPTRTATKNPDGQNHKT